MTLLNSVSMARGAAVLAAAITVAACDSTGEGHDTHYVLVSVNEEALPADHPHFWALEITAGGVTLHGDGKATEFMDVRCRPDLEPGACEVSMARQTRVGTWSLEEGWIRLGEFTFTVARAGGRLTVDYGLPPSMGFSPRATFLYER
ncbi:MAG TPA: hypothetical protein VK929_09830 [Longimicrobiales bacterium]|nr:hypothetical protein [Longimicrobiales bacterium]